MSSGSDEAAKQIHCGVILHPAGHTRSPAMHNAAYRALGLNASYAAYDVPPESLASAMDEYRRRGIRQLAVSIPHKEVMLTLVDEVLPVGHEIGAINTVTRIDDRLVGTNTDWIGGIRALERAEPIQGQRVAVLGAGGTARALVYGLRQRDCEVFVLNRTRERAENLADELGAAYSGGLSDLGRLNPEIVINTTSVGMNGMSSPVSAESLPEGAIVLDAVYAPERTQLLIDAEARGCRVIGGKWMLVYQAFEQLRLWVAQLEVQPSEADLACVADIMADAFDKAGSDQAGSDQAG